MRKLRIIWLIITAAVFLSFAWYRINEVRREDSSGPVIRYDEQELIVSVNDDEAVLLEGMTATDFKDGDVTDSLIVEALSKFYGDKRRMVTYAAFDSDGHVSKLQREIMYSDYVSPRFELSRSLRFKVGEQVDLTGIVRVWDCLDGEITGDMKIRLSSGIVTSIAGTYQVEYQVTNSAGDTVYLPVEVELYESADNEVKIELEKYLIYYEGEEIDYEGLVKSLTCNREPLSFEEDEEEGELVVDSEVNPRQPGVYPVYFTYQSDKYQGTEVLLVVVE